MKKKTISILIFLLTFFGFQWSVRAADYYCEYTYKGATLKVYNIANGYDGFFNVKYKLKVSLTGGNHTDELFIVKTDSMYTSYFGINSTFSCKDLKIKKGLENDCDGPGSQCTTYTFTTEGSDSDEIVKGEKKTDVNSCTYVAKDESCTLNVTYGADKDKVTFKVTNGTCEVSLKETYFFDSNHNFKCLNSDQVVTEVCNMAEGAQTTTFHKVGTSTCDGTSGGSSPTDSPTPNPPSPEDEPGEPQEPEYDSSAKSCVSCGNGALTNIPEQLPMFIRNIVLVLQLLTPVLLIGLGIYDFVRAVTTNDDKMMKDAQNRFIKRIIASVLIFFVVAIVKFAFSLIPKTTDVLSCIPCFISSANSCSEPYTCNMQSFDSGIGDDEGGQEPGDSSGGSSDCSAYASSSECGGSEAKAKGCKWNSTAKKCVYSASSLISSAKTCREKGFYWFSDNGECINNIQNISQSRCESNGYVWEKIQYSVGNYVGHCSLPSLSSIHDKASCEKIGYTWTYANEEYGGHCSK